MIDLHVHSSISDGSDQPEEIIRKAKELGISVVALTDHDIITGLERAENEANRLGVEFIKGIELTASFGEDRLLHILGLGIDPSAAGFMKPYLAYRKTKDQLIGYVIGKLREQGYELEAEDLMPYSSDGYLDRLAAAKWLVAKGHTQTLTRSWIDVIDHFPFIEGELLDMQVALDMVHAAGGKTFLAHYTKQIGLKGYSEKESLQILTKLKSMGLDGIEAYYPTYSIEEHNQAMTYADQFDLVLSGGTDYHGGNRPNNELGIGDGSFEVPDSLLNLIC